MTARTMLAFAAVLATTGVAAAQPTQQIWNQANEVYFRGRYEDAAHEYATLLEREKDAAAERLDAIEAAGFEVPSIDESDPDE